MSKVKRQLKITKNHSFFLFGPRATGKSTLIKDSLPENQVLLFNLLDRNLFIELSADPMQLKRYIAARKPEQIYVVIDEIQLLPDLLYVVHQIMESDNAPIFCLTGSSARKLKKQRADMLGGRAWNYKLHPFTHQELAENFDLSKAINIGTLPQAYLATSDSAAKRTLKSYVSTYIEEEIKVEALVRDLRGFLKFLEISANENGNPLNFSNIARETHNKAYQVKEFFQILEDTLLGFFLYSYTSSTRKLVQHPKFYFFDTGVQRALAGKVSLDLKPATKEYGHAFEHWLIKEIVYLNDYLEKDYKFFYYRTHNGAEVDLIITTPTNEVYAIEIKTSNKISSKDLNGLKSFAELCPNAKLLCATTYERAYEQNGVMLYPWKQLLEVIGLGEA